VINPPAAVLRTGRAANSRRLSEIPGVVAPVIVNLPRAVLGSAGAIDALENSRLRFPLLLRAPGFHNGANFLRVENAGALEAAVSELPGDELTAIQYLDARGADGKYRKYRVMMIGGWLYPLHLAISSHWKIHYVTADMAEDAQHRAEEEKFLRNMPAVLGPLAMAALADIQDELGLDYAGIDFGLSAAGEVLLFEANATMTVVPPGQDHRWDYRRAAIQRVEDAVRKMLAGQAQVTQVR
jgi:glutathione synthase/RimK-type ligase-like ATP-grasp enzyme